MWFAPRPVDRQQTTHQWTGWVAITWEPQQICARNNRRAVFSVSGPCREDIRVSVAELSRGSPAGIQ
jgi:hypothetical protein